MQERIEDLEVRLTRQEDLLEELNRLAFRQQQRIGELEGLCTALAARVKELGDAPDTSDSGDAIPPHY